MKAVESNFRSYMSGNSIVHYVLLNKTVIQRYFHIISKDTEIRVEFLGLMTENGSITKYMKKRPTL